MYHLPPHRMPSNEEWHRLLSQENLTEAEVDEFVRSLRAFIGRYLDDYFRDDLGGGEV